MPEEVKKIKVAAEVKCVALGADIEEAELVEVLEEQPGNIDEEVAVLKNRVNHLTSALDSMFSMVKELQDDVHQERDHTLTAVIEEKKKENKVEIPEGTVFTGHTKGLSYFLQAKEGGFYVGITRYDSLSAAAEGVSGVRRSGWTFWKLPDGKTVKEVFKG
jgi:hypothetical protein